MIKITTLFKKDLHDLSRVTEEVDPENAWAFVVGIPTVKFDGTACAIINGELYKRYDCKRGKKPPEGAIPCQEPDEATGHWPHWVKCDRSNPADVYHFEAFYDRLVDGTYELVGPKINRNPYMLKQHELWKHGSTVIFNKFVGYYDIRDYLYRNYIEGIVFHNPETGQMCKIRRKDFGFDWNISC